MNCCSDNSISLHYMIIEDFLVINFILQNRAKKTLLTFQDILTEFYQLIQIKNFNSE